MIVINGYFAQFKGSETRKNPPKNVSGERSSVTWFRKNQIKNNKMRNAFFLINFYPILTLWVRWGWVSSCLVPAILSSNDSQDESRKFHFSKIYILTSGIRILSKCKSPNLNTWKIERCWKSEEAISSTISDKIRVTF